MSTVSRRSKLVDCSLLVLSCKVECCSLLLSILSSVMLESLRGVDVLGEFTVRFKETMRNPAFL